MHPDRERWNRKFAARSHDAEPNVQLIMYRDRLSRGRALDVACGAGENAAILALAGWQVTACDLSDEAVRSARERAKRLRARVAVVQADAMRLPVREAAFDTVICTYFLDRHVIRDFPRLLRPGGTLFLQTYAAGHLRYQPDFPRVFSFEPGEPRSLLPGLEVILDEEQDDGRRAYALLIARRR